MIGRAYLAAGALAVAFAAGWAVNGWRLNAAHDSEALRAAEVARGALALAEAEKEALAADLRASRDLFDQKLKDAQHETDRLSDRLAAGAGGLRIAAKCPAPAAVPQTAPAASVDPDPGAELDSTARRAYFALRRGIDRTAAQLAACQSELKLRGESDRSSQASFP